VRSFRSRIGLVVLLDGGVPRGADGVVFFCDHEEPGLF
jgi:hypothetical protein